MQRVVLFPGASSLIFLDCQTQIIDRNSGFLAHVSVSKLLCFLCMDLSGQQQELYMSFSEWKSVLSFKLATSLHNLEEDLYVGSFM